MTTSPLNCDATNPPVISFTNGGTATATMTMQPNFTQRVTNDVCAASPKIVVWNASVNDSSTTLYVPDLKAQVLKGLNSVAACSSGAPYQLVFGQWSNGDNSNTVGGGNQLADAQVKAAVAQFVAGGGKALYVASPVDEKWITGTHANCTTAVEANGNNSCAFIGCDGTHPTQYGHLYLGIKEGAAIMRAAPQLFSPTDQSAPIAYSSNTTGLKYEDFNTSLSCTFIHNSTAITCLGGGVLTAISVGDKIAGRTHLSQTPLTIVSKDSDTAFTVNSAVSCCSDYMDTVVMAQTPLTLVHKNYPNGSFDKVITKSTTTDGLMGPATAPTGSCTVEGQWAFSKDGHASVCSSGTWSSKI